MTGLAIGSIKARDEISEVVVVIYLFFFFFLISRPFALRALALRELRIVVVVVVVLVLVKTKPFGLCSFIHWIRISLNTKHRTHPRIEGAF